MKILYFASLRETLGIFSEEYSLPDHVKTVDDLRVHLVTRKGVWEALATMKNLRTAVNQVMSGPTVSLKEEDEVAFFPPVTGG
ncbi:MAG: molybdopterin converting factor subunit 1 [Rhodocyclaceae bacterium]|nr:molybdopterin converting factor subunit 1 [Rhodocyclaceae bacterium]